MKILITGGAGFIGTNLTDRFLKEGNEVISLDNFLSGSERNIEKFLDHPNFRFFGHDIVNPLPLDESVDQIYNLACPASPPQYQRDPINTMKINIFGSLNVLEYARVHGARVFQASTSEVYGNPQEHPQKENYRGNVDTTNIRACYDEGKRAAETLFCDYRRFYGVDIRIVRIFNTYGPYMSKDDGRVVSNFIVQALQGKPITIYGEGEQTRSFQYVSDLVEGFVKLMESENFYGPVNIGNPDEFTISELAQKVIRLTGSKSEIVKMPLPSGDPERRKPDISLAREKLGWEPKIKLEEGLKKTIAYFREDLGLSLEAGTREAGDDLKNGVLPKQRGVLTEENTGMAL